MVKFQISNPLITNSFLERSKSLLGVTSPMPIENPLNIKKYDVRRVKRHMTLQQTSEPQSANNI